MIESKSFFVDFRHSANLNQLARQIGVPELLLEPSSLFLKTTHFERHEIPKHKVRDSISFRTVWQANSIFSDAYKSFARKFDVFARQVEPRFPHPSAHGYIRGRGTIDNAKGHCGASKILHADITNFFPSISSDMLKKLFLRLNIQEEVANIMVEFLTIENSLPLGLHASPLLANLVCLDLDEKLKKLADGYNCTYTRYADDITISGNLEIPTKEEVKNILETEGFILSEKKFRVTKPGQAHYVTGLSVTDIKPRAPRVMKKKLRQELYYCKNFGVKNHLEYLIPDRVKEIIKNAPDARDTIVQKGINRIDGTIRYVSHIEQVVLPHIRKEWYTLLKAEELKPSYQTNDNCKPRQFHFFIDETIINHKDKSYLALSLAQTEDFKEINEETMRMHSDYLADPFVTGDKGALLKNGLHYNDSPEDLRRAYIDVLATLPFRGYLIYAEMKSSDNYEYLYLSLVRKILINRLKACDGSSLKIIFEQNSRVNRNKIKGIVNEQFEFLTKTKDRRPLTLEVIVGKKQEHACFSVPDYLLGVFAKYATIGMQKEEKIERERLFFEALRDKYRVILNADTGMIFLRKRPFMPWE